jgi:hypothetical protein
MREFTMRWTERQVSVGVVALTICLGGQLAVPGAASANEYAPQLQRFLDERVRPFLNDPIVIGSIREQNAAHAGMSQDRIDELDLQWRDEAREGSGPFIDEWMARDLSHFLIEQQAATDGLIAELFVMDNLGLNVGQSEPTSDYWQGDEAKWQKTYLVGPDAVFIDDIDFDDSTGMFLTQVNASIADPDTGEVIGAVTVGVNIEALD